MVSKFVKNSSLIILLIVGWLIQATHAQTMLSLPVRSKNFCPPNKTCEDGSFHFLCKKKVALCPGFERHIITWEERKYFIQAHNGIRNRVAKDFRLANMNLLYWSKDLQMMARRYLAECKLHESRCHEIGEDHLKINMNYSIRSRNLFAGWPARVARAWYVELGTKLNDWDNFLKNYKVNPAKYSNFTQMIWPLTEFVGCEAASVNYGLMLFVVCIYYPAYNPTVLTDYPASDLEDDVILGDQPCYYCNRGGCSKIFPYLCGADNILSGHATTIKVYWNTIIFLYIIVQFMQL